MTQPPQPLPELMEHIVAAHHAFCRREMPRLLQLFQQAVAASAGDERAKLRTLQAGFHTLCPALGRHLDKEEQILFPLIAQIDAAVRAHQPPPRPAFGSVANPIRMMVLEHSEAEVLLAKLRADSGGFQAPAGASAVCEDLFAGLRAFDDDMRTHVALEDKDLFPRAIAAEQAAG